MNKVQGANSAKPSWRYRDDAPPLQRPSLKRVLGAVAAYAGVATGIGALIFWPHGDQLTAALGHFPIPPNTYVAPVSAGLPGQSTSVTPQPTGHGPVVITKQPAPNVVTVVPVVKLDQVATENTPSQQAPVPVPVQAPQPPVKPVQEPRINSPQTHTGTWAPRAHPVDPPKVMPVDPGKTPAPTGSNKTPDPSQGPRPRHWDRHTHAGDVTPGGAQTGTTTGAKPATGPGHTPKPPKTDPTPSTNLPSGQTPVTTPAP